VCFGGGIGIFSSFSALLEQILCANGYSNVSTQPCMEGEGFCLCRGHPLPSKHSASISDGDEIDILLVKVAVIAVTHP
jgi:hypothetical protein